MALPTIEYGLQLISPLCPNNRETLAALAGPNVLCGLLLTTAEQTAYPLERPLVLCRMAVAFLTGLTVAEVLRCTLLMGRGETWLSIHGQELEQVKAWYRQQTRTTLYLYGSTGSGRWTLLLRVCGNVVYCDLKSLTDYSIADQNRAMREAAVLSVLLDAPVYAEPDSGRAVFRRLESICQQYGLFLAGLADEEKALENAKEIVYLSCQLTFHQRREAWIFFAPASTPDAVPHGTMVVGTVKETAALAVQIATGKDLSIVTAEDVHLVLLQRGGALEFGMRYQTDVTMEDMVLSDCARAAGANLQCGQK